jgi:sec-independent protein translocase protein TatA
MDVGPGELIVVLAIALLIFGSERIPEVARSIGRAIREFREGVADTGEREGPASTSPRSNVHT